MLGRRTEQWGLGRGEQLSLTALCGAEEGSWGLETGRSGMALEPAWWFLS